jgi:O-methyltransferase
MADHLDDVIERVCAARLTYLKPAMLRDLADAVLDLEERGVEGALVEAGTALGGSAIVLAAAKAPERPLRVYDAFDLIPPPTSQDGEEVWRRYDQIVGGRSRGIGGDVYYGYREDLLAEVAASFARFGLPVERSGVELVKGYFQDTLRVDYPVALAHLDGDWYASTMTCLERLAPRLVPGGRLVIDDYDFWAGCRRAVDEFFAGRDDFQFVRRQRLHAMRRPAGLAAARS